MAQDIRKMFQEDKTLPADKLQQGHQKRFEAKLDTAFPKQKKEQASSNKYLFLKIAAVLVVAFGIGFIFFSSNDLFQGNQVVDTETTVTEENEKEEVVPVKKEYQLSDVSPEFKKIENYYMASLNIELAKLEVNDENRALVDSFMTQLAELDEEYKRLNAEISETGLNESSVEALIANLQLRLELLFKLKNKLKEINQSKNKDYENFQA
ncbi:MAG TPA: hypothetical protein ENO10_02345 [Salinimicrobium catena]|uniref:Anti-sigma factor n=1 Tax=Salinimicrobium catena TaxID=390640 RepID=A0A7C2M5C4_9FLAO|nr:hypothetical protein [Salinimicrobium catena]